MQSRARRWLVTAPEAWPRRVQRLDSDQHKSKHFAQKNREIWVVAVRRQKQIQAEEQEKAPTATQDQRANASYPRRIVVLGLILYCAVFWIIIWFFGAFIFNLIGTVVLSGPATS